MKTNKIYIIAAICLVLGLALFVTGFAMNDFDYKAFDTSEPFEQRILTPESDVSGIRVDDDNTHVTLRSSADDKLHVICYENDKQSYDIDMLPDGTLSVEKVLNLEWTDYLFNFIFDKPELVIELPEGFEGDISARTDNARITLDGITAGTLAAETDNGNIVVSSVNAVSLTAETRNGRVEFDEVGAQTLSIRTNNGNVSFKDVAADDITAHTDNGKMEFSDVAAKKVIASTNNARIELDRVEIALSLDCRTNNGNIEGTLVGSDGDYSFDCATSNGGCEFPLSYPDAPASVRLTTSNGRIDIELEK